MTATQDRSTGTSPRVDPGRWPDIAHVPNSPARAAIAKRLFRHAVKRLPMRVVEPDGKWSGGGTGTDPVFRLVRPDAFYNRLGADGDDRVRRGLHGRRLDDRRSPRGAVGVRREHARHDPAGAAQAAQRRAQRPAEAPRQHDRGRAAEHPPALRPVQRAVRIVPRRDHDLLVGRVRRRAERLTRDARGRPAAQDRPTARLGRGRRRHPAAGDRHRLGRAGHARGRSWRTGHQPDDLHRAGRARPQAHRRGRPVRPHHRPVAGLPRGAGRSTTPSSASR